MAVMAKSLFRSRKLPAPPQSQQAVEVILEASAQLLEDDANASITRIAQHAGFSIATLRHYFPNRDAILVAMAEREQLRILKGVDEALRDVDPDQPEMAIRAALRFVLSSFQSRQKLRRQMILTLLPRMPDALRGRVFDAVLGEVMDVLELRCVGRFRQLDQTARFVLTRAIMGVVRAAIIEGAVELSDPKLENELLQLMFRFLGTPGASEPDAAPA